MLAVRAFGLEVQRRGKGRLFESDLVRFLFVELSYATLSAADW